MSVDTDTRLSITQSDDQVGSLPAYSMEGEEILDSTRNRAIKSGQNFAAYLADGIGFGAVETAGVYCAGDLLGGEGNHFAGSGSQGEQGSARGGRHFIFGSEADETGDQYSVGFALPRFSDFSHRCRTDLFPMLS